MIISTSGEQRNVVTMKLDFGGTALSETVKLVSLRMYTTCSVGKMAGAPKNISFCLHSKPPLSPKRYCRILLLILYFGDVLETVDIFYIDDKVDFCLCTNMIFLTAE